MPPQLRDAIQAEAERLDALQDAVAAVRSAGDFFAQLDFELEVVAAARIRAVERLRKDGWTYSRIAEETGLSDARVAQLARAGGAGGRVKQPNS